MYDKPLSLLSVSSQPDICTKHSHNVMGTKPLYTRSASSERRRPIQSSIIKRGTSAVTVLSQSDAIEEIIHNLYIGYCISDLAPPVTSLDVPLQPPWCSHCALKGPVVLCFCPSGIWPSCRQWEASGTRRHARGYEASSSDRYTTRPTDDDDLNM